MSMAEFRTWLAYRQKYGPMNDVRRYDRPAALISSMLSHAHGGKAQMKEFMPYGRDDEEKTATLGEIISQFGGVNIGKSR